MVPRSYITEWSNYVPWQSNEQVEEDLVICRALIEIFSDDFLAGNLAFRGGTALHKLYLKPQQRYSEDIDLVQINSGSFGEIADRLKIRLGFLGTPQRKLKANNFTLVYRFESEFPPVQTMKLKIETNCREHFSVQGLKKYPFPIESSWFTGKAEITTYSLEELIGTKLRALYQRKKGRDLYDLYKAITISPDSDWQQAIDCYYAYMQTSGKPPSKAEYLNNLANKMVDPDFLGDTTALLRPEEHYSPMEAFEKVRFMILENL
ncbi:MAG: nucleotidyl transferase AbiEii/AbiGii toxin family protein [Ignavibacteriales bacterium]|nr:nucleotidyl transferase AbiEii/AbiGii toxin family protein [Ignavibacteriales bacterium]